MTYATSVGTFTTRDPLDGIAGQVTIANPYHYANNDPLNQIDPLGLRPVNDADLRGGWSQSTAYQRSVDFGDPYHGTPWAEPDALHLELRRIGQELEAIDRRLRMIDSRHYTYSGLLWQDVAGRESNCFIASTAFCAGYDSLPPWAQTIDKALVQYGPEVVAILLGGRTVARAPATAKLPSTPAPSGAERLLWTSWQNYPKVTQGGREYAQIGSRLYTQHAVDRLQPSGLGAPAGATGPGRSISPNHVEDVISTSRGTPVKGPKGEPRLSFTRGTVQVITEDGIVVTVITR